MQDLLKTIQPNAYEKLHGDYLLQKWKPILDAIANPARSKNIINMPEAQESILGNTYAKGSKCLDQKD
jgi:hypothetical protein